MPRKIKYRLNLLFITILIVFSCKKEKSCEGCKENNKPPIVIAGPDQVITLPTDSISLDGIASSDPDGTISEWLWTKISGPASSTIVNSTRATTVLRNLTTGIYQFELKVTDEGGLFSKDTTQIIVNAQVPPPPLPGNCGSVSSSHINVQLIPFGTLSQAGDRIVAASAGTKIVFAGRTCCPGSSIVDIYDTVTQTWSIAALSVPRWGIAAIAKGNKIFFAGGEFGDGAFDTYYSTVDIYDASNNSWSVASLSQPRSQIAAATVGNKVFFAGGEKDINYNTSNVVDVFDMISNTWTTTTLSEPRSMITAVTVGNRIYFAGGARNFQWNNDISNRIDIYDNATGSWSISDLAEPKAAFAGIAVDNKIYWAGGFNGEGNWGSCQVEIKNTTTGSSSISYLSTRGIWYIDFGVNAVLKDSKIVFLRQDWVDPPSIKLDVLDIATNTWSVSGLPIIFNLASIISVNNTIYVVDGNKVYKLEF